MQRNILHTEKYDMFSSLFDENETSMSSAYGRPNTSYKKLNFAWMMVGKKKK